MDTTQAPLVGTVALTRDEATLVVAALESHIDYLRAEGSAGWMIADAHAALVSVRAAFDRWPMSEAQLDAAHEAADAEMHELADAEYQPDVPLADPDAVMLAYQRGEL